MSFTYTILEPKKLVFKSEYYQCPYCKKRIQKHIICEGARWHVNSWGDFGTRCSQPDCEDNHGRNKCKAVRSK